MIYEGYWKQGKMHGKARTIFNDASMFTGFYLKGERNGEGLFEYADGSSYQGNWSRH
jgi:hypothetical protein